MNGLKHASRVDGLDEVRAQLAAIRIAPVSSPLGLQPDEIADAAVLRDRPWCFVVMAALADVTELMLAGTSSAEIHQHVNVVIAAAEQRLQGAPFKWGTA